MFQFNIINKEKYYAALLVLVVISQSLPAMIYTLNNQQLPGIILSEDGIYESLAAIFCLLAGLVFLYSFVTIPRKVNYFLFSSNRNITALMFSLVLLLLFAEEISWGQRILNIKTPEVIAEVNFQKEMTLHNLKGIQGKNNSLSYALFGMLVAYLSVFPLFIYSFPFTKNIVKQLAIPIASIQICLFVVILFLLNRVNYLVIYPDGHITDYKDIGEIFESNIEMLLFVLSLEYLYIDSNTCKVT